MESSCHAQYVPISTEDKNDQTSPIDLAHRLMEDDQYNGYHIPAGSIVIVNNWSVVI